MAEQKHTPGPWRKCGGFTPKHTAIYSERDGYIVFGMADGSDTEHGKGIKAPGMETQAANARLIAAAPQLLEACQQALRWVEEDEQVHGRKFGTGNALRAALTSASPPGGGR